VTEKEQLDILKEWLKLHKGIIFKVVRAYTVADYDDEGAFYASVKSYSANKRRKRKLQVLKKNWKTHLYEQHT